MTTKIKSELTNVGYREAPRSKTLVLQLGITGSDLAKKLMMAIILAQGGGQDADITSSRAR